MQTKTLTIKAMDDSGKGLAELATLALVDHDGDTYAEGAFGWKEGGQWAMMLPAHDRRAMPFGKARVFEDNGKAMAELFLNLDTQAGKDWHAALKFDLATGNPVQEWSYGYSVLDADYQVRGEERVRVLKRLEVDEVSTVLRGAGVGTRTVAIKGAALREEKFNALMAELSELTDAISATPDAVSAVGRKQLADIQAALAKALEAGSVMSTEGNGGLGGDDVETGADLAEDTAMAAYLQVSARLGASR